MTTPAHPSPSAAHPDAKADVKAVEQGELQLLRLMNDLVSVMEREITVVEERLNAELPDLVARKQRLLADYQAEFTAATAQPQWLRQLPPVQKSLLRAATARMDEVGKRNVRALKAAAGATQRLLQGIMATVREEKCARAGYEHLVQPVNPASTQSVIFKTTA